jgi:hypothetical protein
MTPPPAPPQPPKKVLSPRQHLEIAEKHLERVRKAHEQSPLDWSVFTTYSLYCLEAALMGAAGAVKLRVAATHWDKGARAEELHKNHGLPDVSELLGNLNLGRKAEAYGDIEYDAEDELDEDKIIAEVEAYFEAVEQIIEEQDEQ